MNKQNQELKEYLLKEYLNPRHVSAIDLHNQFQDESEIFLIAILSHGEKDLLFVPHL